jgi:hypothetical protein
MLLFIVGLVIVFVAVVIIRRMLVPASVKAAPHGWMSEQWLAEHRASHPPKKFQPPAPTSACRRITAALRPDLPS